MKTKTLLISFALLIAAILGVSAVFAQQQDPQGGGQDGRGGQRRFDMMPELVIIVADETGLDPLDIAFQLRSGTTLADIITSNGGDVATVVSTAVDTITTHVNDAVTAGSLTQDEADRILNNLEQNITDAINGERPQPDGNGNGVRRPAVAEAEHILIDAVADATGLGAEAIRQQVRDGSTLADIITSNGGTVEAVVNTAVTNATEEINTAVTDGRITQEQADTMIASLETRFTDAINGQFHVGPRPIARELVQLVAEQTGLTQQDIVSQYRAGNSLASILTANGVDVDTFIDTAVTQAETRLTQAVTNGRITQEEADQRLAQLRDDLPTWLNQVPAAQEQGA